MPIDEDRQSKSNNMSGANAAVVAALDSLSATDPAPKVCDIEFADRPLTPTEMAELSASIEPRLTAKSIVDLMRETTEHIKEHDTRYNQNKRDWEEADRKRREEGRDEYNASRRGKYAGQVMQDERRPVRSYATPDSELKRDTRRAQKRASKQAKLDAMTPVQLAAHRTAESAKRAARRAKAKKF